MKRIPSQFDTGRLSNAVATPTCSSCCCCCCCLGTAVTVSGLVGQRVFKATKEHPEIKSKTTLRIAAFLVVPLSLAVGYFLWWTLQLFRFNCSYFPGTFNGSPRTYEVCDTLANSLSVIWVPLVPVLVLGYLYTRSKIRSPWLRAIGATVLIGIAMAIEAALFAPIVLVTAGIGYLVGIIPFAILVNVLYKKTWLSKT